MQSAGTSDGMSSESEEGSGGEGAVLRWAQRQGRTGEVGATHTIMQCISFAKLYMCVMHVLRIECILTCH